MHDVCSACMSYFWGKSPCASLTHGGTKSANTCTANDRLAGHSAAEHQCQQHWLETWVSSTTLGGGRTRFLPSFCALWLPLVAAAGPAADLAPTVPVPYGFIVPAS